jgi:hypothetical protein
MQDVEKKEVAISSRRTKVMGCIYGGWASWGLSAVLMDFLPELGPIRVVLAFLGGHGLSAAVYIWSINQVGGKPSMSAYALSALVTLTVGGGMIGLLALLVGPR